MCSFVSFYSRPELSFSSLFHFSLALRTGFHIPYPDVIAATVQAQATDLTPVRWGNVGDDTTDHNVLDSLAVRATHRGNLLTEEAAPFVYLSFIPTSLTAIFQFPSHPLSTPIILKSLKTTDKVNHFSPIFCNFGLIIRIVYEKGYLHNKGIPLPSAL